MTAWYRRTDEEGRPVGYDYETGTWSDGYRDGEQDQDQDQTNERAKNEDS